MAAARREPSLRCRVSSPVGAGDRSTARGSGSDSELGLADLLMRNCPPIPGGRSPNEKLLRLGEINKTLMGTRSQSSIDFLTFCDSSGCHWEMTPCPALSHLQKERPTESPVTCWDDWLSCGSKSRLGPQDGPPSQGPVTRMLDTQGPVAPGLRDAATSSPTGSSVA